MVAVAMVAVAMIAAAMIGSVGNQWARKENQTHWSIESGELIQVTAWLGSIPARLQIRGTPLQEWIA